MDEVNHHHCSSLMVQSVTMFSRLGFLNPHGFFFGEGGGFSPKSWSSPIFSIHPQEMICKTKISSTS